MFKRAAIFSLLSTSGAAGFRQVARFSSAKPVLAMALKEGDVIPNVVFKARVRDAKIGGDNPFTWKDVSTSDLFKGKRAVVFALPGGTNLLPMLIFFSLQLRTCIAIFSYHMHIIVV
jgi:hypothetical protein